MSSQPSQSGGDWLHNPESLLKVTAAILIVVGACAVCLWVMFITVLGSLPKDQQQPFGLLGFVAIHLFAISAALTIVMAIAILLYFFYVKTGAEARAISREQRGEARELSKRQKVLLALYLVLIFGLLLWLVLNAVSFI